jgi:hypothetical protein
MWRLVDRRTSDYAGEVMTYRATVSRGQVVVRGVDLPNGTEVDVTIEGPVVLTEAYLRAVIREGEAAFRRGEGITAEEYLASRGITASLGLARAPSRSGSRSNQGAVARKSRKRAKRVRRRAG